MDVPKKPFEAIAFLHQDMTKTSFGFTKLALALCALPCEAVRGRASSHGSQIDAVAASKIDLSQLVYPVAIAWLSTIDL